MTDKPSLMEFLRKKKTSRRPTNVVGNDAEVNYSSFPDDWKEKLPAASKAARKLYKEKKK